MEKHTTKLINKTIYGQITALFFIQIAASAAFGAFFSGLSLYLTQNKYFSIENAAAITGLFLSLNYFLQLIGGMIANRVIKYKNLYCLSSLASFAGCSILAFGLYVKTALALFLVSSIAKNVCLRMFITKLFNENQITDRRVAFIWNYIGMNIGTLIGGGLSGYYTISNNYFYLFITLAALTLLSMVLTLIFIKDEDTFSYKKKSPTIQFVFASVIVSLLVIFMTLLFNYAVMFNKYITIMSLLMLSSVIYFSFKKAESLEKIKFIYFSLYSGLAIFFWTIYMLTPTAFMQIINSEVEQKVLGITLMPQWFVNIDSVVILSFGPLFAHLIKRKTNENETQFGVLRYFNLSFLFCGIAFVILLLGLSALSNNNKLPAWSMLGYLISLTMGEIYLAPIGNCLVGELIPEKMRGLMTGAWSVNIGIGSLLSSIIANKFILPYVGKNGLYGEKLVHFQNILIFAISLLSIVTILMFVGRKNLKTHHIALSAG